MLVTPSNNPAGIKSIYDLQHPGVRVLIGTPTVPIGSYTRQILRNFGLLNAILEVTDDDGEIVLEFPFNEAVLDGPEDSGTRH